ncbi:MAG: FAD-binding protein, partial [Trebonia sp.]
MIDVLVAGGGPAGLATAIRCAQAGLSVTVAEPRAVPIDKACGEGLMPDAQKGLAALGVQLTAQDGAAFDGIAFLSERHHAAARFAYG